MTTPEALEAITNLLERGLESRNIHGIRAASRRALQLARDATDRLEPSSAERDNSKP